jgi:ABC-type glycerol-3-phosphate transport system substrate-binding protein
MKTMMRTATAAAAMAILLSACGGSPTAGAEVAGPSFDGGYTIGSGNREVPEDSVNPSGGTTGSQTAEQGGYTIGSGN